ncbi:MAG: AbrB/MazE/SpoVT family DNA-binding domain-containing protein [Ardenticatenaceae bacterium]|nr:AbrB/MazE/SpoVT family DNA-binding domain-containing protein [Anaerolineales bacterium]MCB8981741.1 AbrB/MazE/SpoVT family DNA-binding domain-containing protein [Ardenticatenaceae bacterium]
METIKMSSKGQIIIPKAIRTAHNWQSGQEIEVIDLGDKIILQSKKPFPDTQLKDVAGILAYSGPAKTIEEMELAIAEGAKQTYDAHS